MKIALVCDYGINPQGGGASITAYRIREGLMGKHVDVRAFLGLCSIRKTSEGEECCQNHYTVLLANLATLSMRLNVRQIEKFFINLYFNSVKDLLVKKIRDYDPDLILVNSIHSMKLPLKTIDELGSRWPLAWILHDMWPMTGHCIYSYGCEKYRDGCDESCPDPEDYVPENREVINWNWKEKKRTYTHLGDRLTFIATTDHFAEIARKSIIRNNHIEVIPYPIDVNVFHPQDKKDVRRELGLPEDKKILLFISIRLDNPRKGLKFLTDALDQMDTDDYVILAVGGISEKLSDERIIYTGFIRDPKKMARYYGASDLFIGPSVDEAFGTVFIEAYACGTPVIGFESGGIRDVIEDGVTGILVKEKTPAALKEAIESYFRLPQDEIRAYEERCRKIAMKDYSMDVISERYIMLFEKILDESGRQD
ncbi:glycosyltransferase [Candidatus Altiarchaeota archaeon]